MSQAGGVVTAQDQGTAEQFAMPKSAIATGCVDYVLSLDEIGPVLLQLLSTGQQQGSGATPILPGKAVPVPEESKEQGNG